MAEDVGVAQEFIPTVVDLADNSTVVYAGPCIVRGVYVNTVMSAHACLFTNAAGTTKFTIPASSPAGVDFNLYDATMQGLTVDPNDSATGSITVVWKPFSTTYAPTV